MTKLKITSTIIILLTTICSGQQIGSFTFGVNHLLANTTITNSLDLDCFCRVYDNFQVDGLLDINDPVSEFTADGASAIVTIAEQPDMLLISNTDYEDVSCYLGSDGSAQVFVTGGTRD